MERHDGVHLRRITYHAVIHVELTAKVHRLLRYVIMYLHRAVGLDLRQVLLVYGVGDIRCRQQRHIHIRHDAVQRTGNLTADVRGQFAIDGELTALLQLGRSKTVRLERHIQPHVIQIQAARQRHERAVCAVDRQTVEVHLVMLHHDRRLAQTEHNIVRLVQRRHTQRQHLRRDVPLIRQAVHRGFRAHKTAQGDIVHLQDTVHYLHRYIVKLHVSP